MAALPALLVFLLVHGVVFHDVAVGDRSLSASTYVAGLTPAGPSEPPHLLDVEGAAWVDEPSPYLARAAVAAGELPLWSPGSGLGAPLAANLNSGAGNPLQLPLNLHPTPRVADLFYLGRLLVLAVFTWLALRELLVAPLAAFVGAAIVAYGGYAMAWIAHHPLSSELFLPLMLLGFERGRRGRAGGWALLALAAAGSLVGGKLQASLLCFAFLGVHALGRARRTAGGRGAVTLAATVAGVVLGALLAGYLLVPAAELMARASGLTLGGRAQLAAFTVPWPTLASLALPRLFVPPGHAFADGLPLTPAIGAVATALAAIALVARAAPLRAIACTCVAWALVLLLRNAGAFGDVAARLPVVGGILFVKYTFTAVFALAVAAAIGLDALLAGRVERVRAARAGLGTIAAMAVLAAAAVAAPAVQTFPGNALPSIGLALLVVLLLLALRSASSAGGRAVATGLAVLALLELWTFAPPEHPPRRDPYEPPAFVEFLRRTPGRVIADPDLLVPLTSAAAGLRDVRAIDVLTPASYYAFFTRLVSFCERIIHFTIDPDLALAATAPALDLAGVRWIATRRPLAFDDLADRVRAQVGRERTARLLAGLTRLRHEGGFALGPVAAGDDVRFAFTLTTPFELELAAESEAAVLAWDGLVRGAPGGARLEVRVDGVASDVDAAPLVLAAAAHWQPHEIALAHAGARRRVRLRVRGESADGEPAQVSFGHLGFGPGTAVERRLASERAARHAVEAGELRRAFDDAAAGVAVYENRNALPRAFRVAAVEPTGSLDAALGRLGDGFDFRAAALVAREGVAAVTAALGAGAGAGPGSATIRAETAGTVTIDTAGEGAALLVLADLAYPGWRATLDGRAVPVLTVNGLLRGVVVPAGPHVVEFRYRPTSVVVGLVCSLLGLVALVPYARRSARAHAAGPRP